MCVCVHKLLFIYRIATTNQPLFRMVQTYEDTTRSALLAGADQVGTAES